jgi:Protein of unknown function (DUF3592)
VAYLSQLSVPHRYAWIGGAAFLLGGFVLLLVTAVIPLREAGLAHSWRSTQGMLQDVRVACERPGLRQVCFPHAEYVFRVPDPHITEHGIRDTGRVYKGTAITFADPALASEADRILTLGRYRPGTAVQVFYDPAKPWVAVLERRAPVPTQIWWVGGLLSAGGALILIIGLGNYRAVIKRWRRRTEPGDRAA